MTRLSSKSFGICGSEYLDIELVNDPVSPYYGRRPVPPMLDAQMDRQWMTFMSKKKKTVLTELKKKIFKQKREDWLEIFLSIFILLSNLEFCYRHQCKKLKREKDAVSLGILFISHEREKC